MTEQKSPLLCFLQLLIPLGIGGTCLYLCVTLEKWLIFAVILVVMFPVIAACICNLVDALSSKKE